jgi:hypothetical protein
MTTEFDFIVYIGMKFAEFRNIAPFKDWSWKRKLSKELQRIVYISGKSGLDIYCDNDDNIITIFLYSKKFDDRLADCKFNWTREQVRARYGKPTRTRATLVDLILGEFGEADIFAFQKARLNVQYKFHVAGIELYTFMKLDEL